MCIGGGAGYASPCFGVFARDALGGGGGVMRLTCRTISVARASPRGAECERSRSPPEAMGPLVLGSLHGSGTVICDDPGCTCVRVEWYCDLWCGTVTCEDLGCACMPEEWYCDL
ncbi:hypothetical protein NDU88_000082 [Pleurodeles waltl]|uniref:Uncharacterized protein n=1 Tax=Pleurodeles waltl TaxID=8319 RepID=A0AAV7Q308_PLEWA|nr:hypothetical protein NDU88_000082 [Pleurodeles waltl]